MIPAASAASMKVHGTSQISGGMPRQRVCQHGSSKVISVDTVNPSSPFRRRSVVGMIGFSALAKWPSRARGSCPLREVEMPLHWAAGGFSLWFTLSSSEKGRTGKKRIKAVADTGSPFLLVAKCLRKDCESYCAEVGCFEGQGAPSGEADSTEGYASGIVEVAWRKSDTVTFPDATDSSVELREMRFGVQGRIIGFGGTGKAVFLGLIRDHMSDIKTSFLEQTPFQYLVVDLREPGRETLRLSEASALTARGPRIKLADPRRWGDPVKHYCAGVKTLRVGGEVVLSSNGSSPRKVLAIFDTGTTGVSMTPGLYESYWLLAQSVAQSGLGWSQARQLQVFFESTSGSDASFAMYMGKHPSYGIGLDLVTPIREMAWAGVGSAASLANYKVPGGIQEKPPFEDVMLLGLGFLVGKCIAIDTKMDELIVIES
ncbi:unnamed protein product [Symbiodinium sp. CCMP2592]|nr:unnamed protein product [Symbiodinium sp. CCMP2592]